MMHERNSEKPVAQPLPETRIVGGRVMKFTMVEPEPPEVVKERDKVEGDFSGSRRMVDVALGVETFGRSTGRKAPRYSGPQSQHPPRSEDQRF